MSPHYIEQAKEYAQKEKIMRKGVILSILYVWFFSFLYAYEPYEKEYNNESVNNNVYYTGKVKITPEKKQQYSTWEIEANSVKFKQPIVVIQCLEKTKVYTDFKNTLEDDYTQYIIYPGCEFLANGKIDDQWIYIKLLEGEWRWISKDKIRFITGSLQELPELKFQKSYNDELMSILFYENVVHIWSTGNFGATTGNNMISEILPLKKNTENQLNYINFDNKKYLMLANDNLLSLINDNNKEIYYGVNGIGLLRKELFGHSMPDVFSASSELKEKNIIYSAKNLDNQDGNAPWVEAVKGDGIGEYIHIQYDQIQALIISNGYVDFHQPYLYENNNRVKLFDVYNQDDKKIQEIELKDRPNPQIFKIAEKCQSIKLVIKEIYKGNKWEDTCINYIKIIPDFCSLDGFVLNN